MVGSRRAGKIRRSIHIYGVASLSLAIRHNRTKSKSSESGDLAPRDHLLIAFPSVLRPWHNARSLLLSIRHPLVLETVTPWYWRMPQRISNTVLCGRARGGSAAALLATLYLAYVEISPVGAVMPTAGIRLSNGEAAYAAPAWFGLQVPEEGDASYFPLRVPSGDADGCEDVSVEDPPEGGFALLVERGNCFFDIKALAAQEAGAKALVVMNSVEGIYQVCV